MKHNSAYFIKARNSVFISRAGTRQTQLAIVLWSIDDVCRGPVVLWEWDLIETKYIQKPLVVRCRSYYNASAIRTATQQIKPTKETRPLCSRYVADVGQTNP